MSDRSVLRSDPMLPLVQRGKIRLPRRSLAHLSKGRPEGSRGTTRALAGMLLAVVTVALLLLLTPDDSAPLRIDRPQAAASPP